MFDNYLKAVNSYSIIIYARLSKEELGKSKSEQSKSIKNQIEICKRFIYFEQKEYPDCHFKIVAILKDDGVSGTTFNRNDFKKLLKKIELKQANMVITKDLSRLGRDHIKTDDYIENWFPEHNIRYVSVMESIDTYKDSVSNEVAPLINWSNEYFARQTSKKIKSTFNQYRTQGKWTGGEPPLGYKLDPHNKYHFIVDKMGKDIVKRIFELALENNSPNDIAMILIKEQVPIPTLIKGYQRKLNQELKELWNSDTIRKILENKMYLGHMIQGKTTRLNHKSKTIIHLPKEQWIVKYNTHEPIIDEKTFNTVGMLLNTNKNKTQNSYDYLLKGLIKCRECHHSIGIQHFKKRKTNYTICNYYRKYGSKKSVCTAHRQNYELLEKAVLNDIKEKCFKYINFKNIVETIKDKKQLNLIKNDLELKVLNCRKEINKINNSLDNLYKRLDNNIIDEKQFLRLSETNKKNLLYEESLLKRYNEDLKNSKNEPNINYDKIVKDFLELKKLNKITIVQLIKEIYLSEDGTIEIYYNIQEPK